MKVIIKQPGKEPEVAEIENTLPALQQVVGGCTMTDKELVHRADGRRAGAARVYRKGDCAAMSILRK